VDIFDKLPKPFVALAPMYDVTDTVFRQIIADCAPADLYFTEFVNVDGLQSKGRSKIDFRLRFSAIEQPLIAQIWGLEPENYRQITAELVKMGFAGIDINFGCPDKAVVKNGCCIALANNRPLAAEIIQATYEGVGGKVPISVKTRLGFNDIDPSWFEFLLQQNLDMLTIHGRTRREMSKVPAHWYEIGKIRELRDQAGVKTLIVGNGDVPNRRQALELAAKYQLDGIMIGRGVFNDPFAFAEHSPWPHYTSNQRLGLYKKHVELFAQTWQNHERPIQTLNKFCKIYINGFDGAKELREQLMQATSSEELLAALKN
jgi:tRNA-dihydrouridine synthase